MLKVGITGGIGSGKSLMCKVFKCLGIPIYYADDAAKHLYDSDEQLRYQMINLFGSTLYENNLLNRKILASIIFNNKDALKQVTEIVHPAVERDFSNWAQKQSTTIPYVIIEAAILFESTLWQLVDKAIAVTSPETIRIQRACMRDNISTTEVKKRIANQITDDERNKRADFIIISNNSTPVLPQILQIHNTLISLT